MANRFFHFFMIPFFIYFATIKMEAVYGEQDVWMIDSHSISWNQASKEEFAKIKFLRLQNNQWESTTAEKFLASQNPEVPLIVFSPGYTSTTSNTIEVGLGITRLIKTDKPYRIVFWNWPAQRVVRHLVPDIRTKIPVAAASGKYMALFLQFLKPQSKVCLLGFSFGNRIIKDAVIHWGNDQPKNLRIHIVMASAATDQNDLSERTQYADMPNLVEKILILYNPDDFRLSFYPYLYGPTYRTDALGLNGPTSAACRKFGDQLEAVNMSPYIGIRHKTLVILNTPPFRQRINTYLLFE